MMRLPLLLGLLAVGLAALIMRELEDAPGAISPAPPPVRPSAAPAVAAAPPEHGRDWLAQSLARPLFNPDRRPAPVAAASADGGPADALPRLTGILVTPSGRRAIFAGEDRPRVLQEGGVIGPYTVRSISNGTIELSGPDGPRLLQPSFTEDDARGRVPSRRPAAGSAAAFNANPAPSGLDIIRNAARQAPAIAGAVAPEAGVDTNAAGLVPDAAGRPPGRPGARPDR